VKIGGIIHDGMESWHVLNSDLRRNLGTVSTFFHPRLKMWKHTSSAHPAEYNGTDAYAADVNHSSSVVLLKKHQLWGVYKEQILDFDPVTTAMTLAGMPIDKAAREASSKQITTLQRDNRAAMQPLVPAAARRYQPKEGYVRTPVDTTGLVEVVFDGRNVARCNRCGLVDPKAGHFKSKKKNFCSGCGAARGKKHAEKCFRHRPEQPWIQDEANQCAGAEKVTTLEGLTRWAKPLPFVPSPKQILNYIAAVGHEPYKDRNSEGEFRSTTNVKAMKKMVGKYHDPIYSLILLDRKYTKLGGTYVGWWDDVSQRISGGFPVGADGRVHTIFTNAPSTLRTSTRSPNLQNLPRGADPLATLVKAMFVAPGECEFWARDFSGIEAVLVGYAAGSHRYTRLAKLGVHDYFLAHGLLRPQGLITDADLPNLAWSDSDLKEAFKALKAKFKAQRDVAKRCVHLSNYVGTPGKMHEEYPEDFLTKKSAALAQGAYFELFPEIPTWHWRICRDVDKKGFIRTHDGFVHRFYSVLRWRKIDGKWEPEFGDDAKRLVALGPQHEAAVIGKEAGKRIFHQYPDARGWLRLFIHDEWLMEVPEGKGERADQVLTEAMNQPVKWLPLDPSWNMGTHLAVGTEGKHGPSWAEMH
jgi:DNA polymerase family A